MLTKVYPGGLAERDKSHALATGPHLSDRGAASPSMKSVETALPGTLSAGSL
jgi:hypothetical protein